MSKAAVKKQGISIRAFGRLSGYSHEQVRIAIRDGDLKPFPDGTLDPALAGTPWCKTIRRQMEQAPAAPTSATPQQAPGAVLPAPEAPIDPEAIVTGSATFISRVLAGNYETTSEAERIKQNALALKHVLEVQRIASGLIRLDVAESVFFETSRAARDSWMNWPVRAAPLMAADLGMEPDKLLAVLNEYVHRHLVELGEPQPEFADAEA